MPEGVHGEVVFNHFKVELATGKGEEVFGVVLVAPADEFGFDNEVGVDMSTDLERQGQEGGRRVHIGERARVLDNKSMMGIKRIYYC